MSTTISAYQGKRWIGWGPADILPMDISQGLAGLRIWSTFWASLNLGKLTKASSEGAWWSQNSLA